MTNSHKAKIKLRPVLTLEDLENCIASLQQTNPSSKTLAVLNLYVYKQGLGLITPIAQSKEVEPELSMDEQMKLAQEELMQVAKSTGQWKDKL